MSKAPSSEAKLRRIGQTAYKEIIVPRRRSPVPAQLETSKIVSGEVREGIEYAREPISTKDSISPISPRFRTKAVQHIVASRTEEDGSRAPWRYRVKAQCNAILRRAAVKAGRQFLDLAICPICWRNVV